MLYFVLLFLSFLFFFIIIITTNVNISFFIFLSNKNFQSDKIQSRRGERTGVRVVYNFYPRRCSIILYYIVFSDTSHLIPEFIDAIHRDYDAICNNNGSVNYTHSDNWFKLLEWSFVETNELYKWEKKNKNKKYTHTAPCITYTHHLILYPWTTTLHFWKYRNTLLD